MAQIAGDYVVVAVICHPGESVVTVEKRGEGKPLWTILLRQDNGIFGALMGPLLQQMGAGPNRPIEVTIESEEHALRFKPGMKVKGLFMLAEGPG